MRQNRSCATIQGSSELSSNSLSTLPRFPGAIHLSTSFYTLLAYPVDRTLDGFLAQCR